MLLALLSLAAQGSAYDNWLTLHDALLFEALNGDFSSAEQLFERLIHDSPGDDPSRAASLYWLGRSHYLSGAVEQAKETLLDCVRRGDSREACLILLEHIETEALAIRHLPVSWSFDDGQHGLSHPWLFNTKGAIKIAPVNGNPALLWTTQVDLTGDDQLHLLFDRPVPPPSRLQFSASTTHFNAHLRVVIFDQDERRYFTQKEPVVEIQREKTSIVTVDFNKLRPAKTTDPSFRPDQVHRVVLQDISSAISTQTGPNTLIIDDFKID